MHSCVTVSHTESRDTIVQVVIIQHREGKALIQTAILQSIFNTSNLPIWQICKIG